MTSTLHLHVGSTQEMGKRFAEAFRRGEAGEHFEERHITFLELPEMMATLSPRRLELLRHLHREGEESVMALARALGRDYKHVHEDVALLETSGLILRVDGRLTAPWDALAAEVEL